MYRTVVRCAIALGLGLVSASSAFAQFGVASLSYADGGVTRLHGGAPAATTIGVSIMDGDQIETGNGRAEIAFLDGTVIQMDRYARVMVQAGDRFQALSGRISLRTSGMKHYVAETTAGKLLVQSGSVVEIISNSAKGDAYLRVINGMARIENQWGTQQVPDYTSAYVAAPTSAPLLTKVTTSTTDEFERWALSRTILATSTPLKGTEGGGGVAYHPALWAYSSWYYPYSYTAYSSYYGPYYYPSSYYYSPYYSSPSYYSTPYYYSSSYYYVPPVRSYYGGYYGSYYPSYQSYSWRTSGPGPSAPSSPIFTPRPIATPAPAGGAIRGVAIPRP
jgi:hypothetical protein